MTPLISNELSTCCTPHLLGPAIEQTSAPLVRLLGRHGMNATALVCMCCRVSHFGSTCKHEKSKLESKISECERRIQSCMVSAEARHDVFSCVYVSTASCCFILLLPR
jgi:hypothetical protein